MAHLKKEFNMQLQKNSQVEKAVEIEKLALNSVFLNKFNNFKDLK